jgi:hypothetical protein
VTKLHVLGPDKLFPGAVRPVPRIG